LSIVSALLRERCAQEESLVTPAVAFRDQVPLQPGALTLLLTSAQFLFGLMSAGIASEIMSTGPQLSRVPLNANRSKLAMSFPDTIMLKLLLGDIALSKLYGAVGAAVATGNGSSAKQQ
jgi:hypothetical protein